MSRNQTSKEWADEYQAFVSVEEIQPPALISNQIHNRVQADLNPAPWVVFSKLVLIHIIVGTTTLLFCPQFGFRPFSGIGLMDVFMRFGEVGCMLGCGAVYVGSSTLAASMLLKPEQMKVLRRTAVLQIPLLGLLSLGAFICIGASALFEVTLIGWFLGSIVGGIATLELGWLFRRKVMATK